MIYFSGVVITAIIYIAFLYVRAQSKGIIYLSHVFLGIILSACSWIPVVIGLIVLIGYLISECGSIVVWKKK